MDAISENSGPPSSAENEIFEERDWGNDPKDKCTLLCRFLSYQDTATAEGGCDYE